MKIRIKDLFTVAIYVFGTDNKEIFFQMLN